MCRLEPFPEGRAGLGSGGPATAVGVLSGGPSGGAKLRGTAISGEQRSRTRKGSSGNVGRCLRRRADRFGRANVFREAEKESLALVGGWLLGIS